MPITATAPGKLMLLGEHAVVYDQPCLVTAVGLHYSVTLTPRDDLTFHIQTGQLDQPHIVALADVGTDAPRETAFVEAVIARFRDQYGLTQGLSLQTEGPEISYGLGSSSAVTVATAAALDALLNTQLSKRALFDLTYGAVLDVQGRGSGFDVASAIYGGTIYFRKDIPEIAPISLDHLPIVIGYSGSKVGTVNLVAGVAALRDLHPSLINPIFATVGNTVEEARPSLSAGAWQAFGRLMNINQGLTDSLGVNTAKLSALIYAARDAGALGAKLSGAGGGDCMFALAPTSDIEDAVRAAIRSAGGAVLELPLGVTGVQVKRT
jgi:mevalonate kinase